MSLILLPELGLQVSGTVPVYGTEKQTQGFLHAGQALCKLSHL